VPFRIRRHQGRALAGNVLDDSAGLEQHEAAHSINKQGVGGRDKPGHDGRTTARRRHADQCQLCCRRTAFEPRIRTRELEACAEVVTWMSPMVLVLVGLTT
jgi:hypothetical protein